jgi:hypothetical protein
MIILTHEIDFELGGSDQIAFVQVGRIHDIAPAQSVFDNLAITLLSSPP